MHLADHCKRKKYFCCTLHDELGNTNGEDNRNYFLKWKSPRSSQTIKTKLQQSIYTHESFSWKYSQILYFLVVKVHTTPSCSLVPPPNNSSAELHLLQVCKTVTHKALKGYRYYRRPIEA